MAFPWAAAVSGGAGILDGLLRGKQQATQNRMASNQYWNTHAENKRQFNKSLGFAQHTLRAQRQEAQTDRDLQEYFAKNSTGWQFDQLMQAADESGIHRLAAIGGASGTPYAPVGGIGAGGPAATGGAAGVLPSAGDPAFFGDAVGMAMEAARAKEADRRAEEALALDKARSMAEVERTAAEAELMRSQSRTLIAETRRAATGGKAGGGNTTPVFGDAPAEGPPEAILRERVMPDGTIRKVYEGPDIGEQFGGWLLNMMDKIGDAIERGEYALPERRERRTNTGSRNRRP